MSLVRPDDATHPRPLPRRFGVRRPAPGDPRPQVRSEALEARVRDLDARDGAAGHAEVRALGDEFHRYLLKRPDNTKLMQVLEQMREEVQPVGTMSIVAPGRAPALVREHLAIIDALKRADGRRADRLMRLHIRRVRDAIFRLVD